jgi:NADP-dependent 3-hydroxy acid dehydrogenase YdfG
MSGGGGGGGGRVILITGAASGIGAALAKTAEEGCLPGLLAMILS